MIKRICKLVVMYMFKGIYTNVVRGAGISNVTENFESFSIEEQLTS